MRALIATPCFNSEKLIERTIVSVLSQVRDDIELTYIVMDGGSTDGTVEILKTYQQKFARTNSRFVFFSKKDSGMYDAVASAFDKFSTEEFDAYAYINAGDFYAPRAFMNLKSVFGAGVHWVTGITTIYNDAGDIIGAKIPGPYSRRLIRNGVFGPMLPCIQQESTFWDHSAHLLIDFGTLKSLKLAGDFYLWKTFSAKYNLSVVSVWLSGFSIHSGQLSEIRRDEYFDELKKIADAKNFIDYLLAFLFGIMWSLPNSLKLKYFRKSIFPLSNFK